MNLYVKNAPSPLVIPKPRARPLHAEVPCNYILGRLRGRTSECFWNHKGTSAFFIDYFIMVYISLHIPPKYKYVFF